MSAEARRPPAGRPATRDRSSRAARLLRDRSGAQRVTSIELFFDLVYVFAVTQLSHYLLRDLDVGGALRTALLLTMVWLVWSYTTWVTNWLDPEHMQVRLLLIALMLASLAMSAALPVAFAGFGLLIGAAYAIQQVGRTLFMVIALRGNRLERNFQRVLAWCVAGAALAVGGGFAHGHARELLWLGAVGVDVLGGITGFATPGLGRSRTSDWTIEGGHFSERRLQVRAVARVPLDPARGRRGPGPARPGRCRGTGDRPRGLRRRGRRAGRRRRPSSPAPGGHVIVILTLTPGRSRDGAGSSSRAAERGALHPRQ